VASNVAKIAPQVADIHAPAPLRDLPIWLTWRFEGNLDGGKPLKVPYYSFGGRRAGRQGAPEDRAKLTTFAVAKAEAAKRGMDGVGFAALDGNGICALDFDHCVRDGVVDPEVLKAIGATYAEYSPSGTGVRAIVRGDFGNRKSHATAVDYGFETFSSSGFVTITGNILPHVDLVGLEDTLGAPTPELTQLCERRFGSAAPKAGDPSDFMAGREPKLGLTPERMAELVSSLDPDVGRDDWIKVGMAIHHETDGSDDGFLLWDSWSATGYKYPSEEALRGQWDSFERRKGLGQKQVTMATVIRMAQEAAKVPATVDSIAARADSLLEGHEPTGGARTPDGWEGKFPVHSALAATRAKPTEWLIKGVLPAADLCAVYGGSGSGKTFVVLDMAAAIATGTPWRGHKTRKGRVLVVAAEGAGGFGNRVQALCSHIGVPADQLDIGLITVPPNILEDDDIAELVASIKAVGEVSVIVIDTLAQVTPGANENTSEDMGKALVHCRVISTATGATVLLVHHSGKDATRGARGWSGFKAAMDAEIEVIRHEDSPIREIAVRKQKDGSDGARWGFKLDTVMLGLDADGDPITSCVVTPVDEVPKPAAKEGKGVKRRGTVETHILEVMELFGPNDVVTTEHLISKAVELMPKPEEGKRDTRRQMVARALHSISREKDGPLKVDGGIIVFYE